MPSRREFLRDTMTAAAGAVVLPRIGGATTPAGQLADDPLRPQYHLLPPGGWMNDPNGPIGWNGQTHLFYQANPHGADWGDISWGHAVSPDLVHWQHLPVALTPQPGSPDSYGVFSGSCIRDGNRCLAFYTAVAPAPSGTEATLVGSPYREQQCVATSTGQDLRTWTKQPQPLIATPPFPRVSGFRDPCVWVEGAGSGRTWYMALGSGQVDGQGDILLYRATVPDGPHADWTYVHPMFSAPGSGKHTPDTVDAGTMFECPDFFLLDGHAVLLYSTERKCFWMTGELTGDKRFVPKQRGMLDTGAYYAPKSMVTPSGERILWGWIPEKREKADYIAAGWAGCMSLPRVLRVAADGTLRITVFPAIDMLRTGPVQRLPGEPGQPQAITIAGSAAHLRSTLAQPGDGFTLTMAGAEFLKVARGEGNQVVVNGQAVTVPASAATVTALLDASVAELFFGGGAVHTLRFYPKLDGTAPSITASLSGAGSLELQAVRPISPNRLTT